MNKYVVQQGDSLWKIAQRFGLSLDALIAANPQIANPSMIQVGQQINVPVNGSMMPTIPVQSAPIPPASGTYSGTSWQYVVKAGDTMWRIAKRTGVSLADLVAANPQIADPNKITPLQVVNIPGVSALPPISATPSLSQIQKESYTAPMYKEKMTAPKPPAYQPPVVPPQPPVVPPIHVDANLDFNYTKVNQESHVTPVIPPTPVVPKMKPMAPSVAKIYVKETVVKESKPVIREPIGEQIICWDPLCPPPNGPVYEGPVIYHGHSVPFVADHQVAPTGSVQESSSVWSMDAYWLQESSSS